MNVVSHCPVPVCGVFFISTWGKYISQQSSNIIFYSILYLQTSILEVCKYKMEVSSKLRLSQEKPSNSDLDGMGRKEEEESLRKMA